MSRRQEFEHRTSIFESTFRAWSHLGGLDPADLVSRLVTELDPLTNPIVDDARWHQSRERQEVGEYPDGSRRCEYPNEPLPRSGLAHPYVQAILSIWLDPDADDDAIQLGLTTLRIWWQCRRRGETRVAIVALAADMMQGILNRYTHHFFNLGHSLVMNNNEQLPRSLHRKIVTRSDHSVDAVV